MSNLVQNFENDGFVIIDNAYSRDELAQFGSTLLNIIQLTTTKAIKECGPLKTIKSVNDIDSGLLTLRHADPKYVSIVQRTISRSPEFSRLSTQPKIMAEIKNILGMSTDYPLYVTNNGILFTAPSDGDNKRVSNIELPWHNDVFHTIPRSHFVQIWAPLIHDATQEIGTLIVCPGSHKEGVGQQIFNAEDLFFYRYMIEPKAIEKYHPISLELKLGQLLIFSGALYHKSGTNISSKVRCSVVGAYHNITTDAFLPLSTEYKYFGQTPEAYFYEVFDDPKVKPYLTEQAYLDE